VARSAVVDSGLLEKLVEMKKLKRLVLPLESGQLEAESVVVLKLVGAAEILLPSTLEAVTVPEFGKLSVRLRRSAAAILELWASRDCIEVSAVTQPSRQRRGDGSEGEKLSHPRIPFLSSRLGHLSHAHLHSFGL
jgi:hypothetical protein